jgi:hypothetical protein
MGVGKAFGSIPAATSAMTTGMLPSSQRLATFQLDAPYEKVGPVHNHDRNGRAESCVVSGDLSSIPLPFSSTLGLELATEVSIFLA